MVLMNRAIPANYLEKRIGNKPFLTITRLRNRWEKAWESNVRDDYDSSEMDRWGKLSF